MKATDIKRFFAKLGYKVRVRTSTGKGQWIQVWIPCSNKSGHTLIYDQPEFPLSLRVVALKIIYPTLPGCWSGNAGNIRSYSMSIQLPGWEALLATYTPEA